MTNKELFENAWENTWRLEELYHLATMRTDFAYASGLADALDDLDDTFCAALGIPGEALDESWDRDDLSSWLLDHDKNGFIALAATPFREYFSKKHCSFSWGCYATRWFYAETFEALAPQIAAWVDELDKKAQAAFTTAESK